jgi:uncharacterized protein (DUF1778 family)
MATRNSTIQFRVTNSENSLIRMAAELKGVNINTSEYVRQSAIKQAEIDLAQKNKYSVSENEMAAILAALESPAVKNLNLSKLLSEKSILE